MRKQILRPKLIALFGLALWAGLIPATMAISRGSLQAPAREPIRVGGNVQESKLIHRVEPVYPEEARAARVSGIVILQVTVNERGDVQDVRVLRGHPLLDKPAVDAVKQWRYSPTLLNGEPVPVLATVTVAFNAGITLIMDEAGMLHETNSSLGIEKLVERLKESKEPVVVVPNPNAPFQLIEERLRALISSGVEHLQVRGPYVFREGRLFHTVSGEVQSPQLALDTERLVAIAKSSWRLEESPARDGKKLLLYQIYLSEVGEILSIQQLRGPKIPDVEFELARTRVITPGRRGMEPVPVVFVVEVVVD